MGRKIALLYTVFSILALVVLSVWTTYSLLQTKTHNLAAATRRFDALARDVASMYTSSGGYETATFRSFVRSLFLSDPTLEVVLIESPQSGLQYLFARHAGYIQSPGSLGRSWHGSIVYNATLERLFSAPLRLSSHPHAEVQAVYAIFDRDSLYPTLRPLLAALLGFVLLTGIVIALLSILRSGRLPAAAVETDQPPHGPLGRPEADVRNVRSTEAAGQTPPPVPPKAPPLAQTEPLADSPEPEGIPEERVAGRANDVRWSTLAEEVVPLGLESDRPPLASPAPRTGDSHLAKSAGDELPPGVVLPSLEEIGDEAALEISPGRDAFPQREGAHARESAPADEAAFPATSEERHPSADDELADIEDFEDLETLDGSPASDEDEPHWHPSKPPRRQEPRQPATDPKSFELHEEDEEIAELEEILDEIEEPAVTAGPPTKSTAHSPSPVGGGGGLLKRLLAQGATQPAAEGAPTAASASAQEPEAYPQSDRGTPHGLFAPETGLGWSEYFEKRLSFEIDRCASFDQDLSIAVMRCKAPIGSEGRKELARQILLNFTFQDLCFEYGADGFAVILPNLDIDGAQRKLETFQNRVAEEEESLPVLCIGLAARNGRLLPGARLRAEAESALAKALTSATETIAAVRVDPGLYRRRA